MLPEGGSSRSRGWLGLFDRRDPALVDRAGFQLLITPGSLLRIGAGDGVRSPTAHTDSIIPVHEWTHVTASCDGTRRAARSASKLERGRTRSTTGTLDATSVWQGVLDERAAVRLRALPSLRSGLVDPAGPSLRMSSS